MYNHAWGYGVVARYDGGSQGIGYYGTAYKGFAAVSLFPVSKYPERAPQPRTHQCESDIKPSRSWLGCDPCRAGRDGGAGDTGGGARESGVSTREWECSCQPRKKAGRYRKRQRYESTGGWWKDWQSRQQ